jgi:tRNA U34 5-methylaminomethyl-2-thiouridine-forming methyltransferase MnmC
MNDLEIITTSDGSHTLRNKQLNETYHSIHGAVQESMHVFIQHGLEYYCVQHRPESVSILEVGFGTGLNALLSAQHTMHTDVSIRYTTIEPFPLPSEIWSVLNYGDPDKGGHLYRALHEAAWNQEVSISPKFTILKIDKTLADVALEEYYDIIYFDAFAPQIQPQLWSYASLEKVVGVLTTGGVFVTYSAKGQLKRDLKTLGLKVDTLPGPPGKNEMVRGVLLPNDKIG